MKKIIFLAIVLFAVGGFFRPIFAYYHEQTSQNRTEEQQRIETLQKQQRLLEAQKKRLETELRETKQGREDTASKPKTRLEQKYYFELKKLTPKNSDFGTVRDEYERQRDFLKSYLLDNSTGSSSFSSGERAEKFKSILEEQKDEVIKSTGEMRRKLEDLRLEKEKELSFGQEELKKRTQEFLSEKKAQTAEKLSKKLNFINDKITDTYLRHLEKWNDLLDRMDSRADNLTEESFNTSEVKLKIAAARNAILKANEQILIQKAKIYTVKIDDEESVGEIFSQARKELGNDLERLKKEVMKPIKEILREIHQSFKETVRVNKDKKDQTGISE